MNLSAFDATKFTIDLRVYACFIPISACIIPFVISNYIIVSIRNPFLRGHQIGWLWTLDRSNELSVPLNLLLVLLNLVPSHSFTSESTYGSIKLIITFQILISCVRHSAYLSPGLIHLWNVTGHITRRKNSDFIDSGLPSVSLSLFPFTFSSAVTNFVQC